MPQFPTQSRAEGPDLYGVLGLAKGASTSEIKRAYRSLALKFHPDKCEATQSNDDKFKEINSAYEVLSDTARKQKYDQFGITEDNEHAAPQQAPEFHDVFSQLFGNNVNFQQRQQQTQKHPTTEHVLNMTLEELFAGKTFRMNVSRDIVCTKCSGRGGSVMQTCPGCQGKGHQTSMRNLGPGFMQQVQTQCAVCSGSTEIAQDTCTDCSGKKTRQVTQAVEVKIQPGANDSDRHTFAGIGNAAPNMQAGDVVFVVKQQPHPVFTRRDNDIHMDIRLTLKQSLCGYSVNLKHLDGSSITLQSKPGMVTKPNSTQVVAGKGMTRSGNLIVTHSVEFPEHIRECADLALTLPKFVSVKT